MKQSSYWKERFLDIARDRDNLDTRYVRELDERYNQLADNIQKEIDDWVKRYAENDEITEEAANKLLSRDEQRTWRMTLSEYRKKAITGGYNQQLNREYYRSRITRLEKLKRQIYFELAEQANTEVPVMDEHLSNVTSETYYRYIYEMSDFGTLTIDFAHFNPDAVQSAIYKPWKGYNFSERVWGHHTNAIPNKLSDVLADSFSQGWGIDKTVDEMMEGVHKNLRNRMVTLVQTESAHMAEQATQRSYRETGVDEYMWLATLEVSTCEQCQKLDTKVFEVDGEDSPLPPDDTHPNCRCTTVPHYEGIAPSNRWYRDPETGKGQSGDFMSYEEWKEKHNVA